MTEANVLKELKRINKRLDHIDEDLHAIRDELEDEPSPQYMEVLIQEAREDERQGRLTSLRKLGKELGLR